MIGGSVKLIGTLIPGAPDMVFPRIKNIRCSLLPHSLLLLLLRRLVEKGAGTVLGEAITILLTYVLHFSIQEEGEPYSLSTLILILWTARSLYFNFT
ncbi:unnamed protein product, partial [Callosobruchus maculatus]